jgi:cyclic beta-1,2-glucan synthetase
VLDPVLSLRCRARLAPGASAVVTFSTAVADSRDEALALADHYRDPQALARTFELAWASSQIELAHLEITSALAHLFQRLATGLLFLSPTLRPPRAVRSANRQGQTGLWKHGISGDRPIALATISEEPHLDLAKQMVNAHAYWRARGIEVDLVLLNEQPTTYQDDLQHALLNLVRASANHALADQPGGLFVRKSDQLAPEERTLLLAAASVVLQGDRGTLASQLERIDPPGEQPLPLVPVRKRRPSREPPGSPGGVSPGSDPSGLLFANGLGGFTPDGKEYHVFVAPGRLPPAPWINVVANPGFGFYVSEAGSGYTWSGNSQQNRLTPWGNDPVSDAPGEVVYVRDEETGAFWSPTLLPCGAGPVRVRHGQGYTTFEQHSQGLAQSLTLFVPKADPVKVVLLKVRNEGNQPRRLSAVLYAEWVLGTTRHLTARQLLVEPDGPDGALLARNPFNIDFPEVAFAAVSLRPRTFTSDRTAFLGRNGSLAAPAALSRVGLSARTGAVDPCAALHAPFEVPAGEEKVLVFLLGVAPDVEGVRRLVRRYRDARAASSALEEVTAAWDEVLTAVQVKTPDRAVDLMLNRWLLYQVRSCRVWGRSALYQSGGAFGFRDQLQDVLALVHSAPGEARGHILRSASRQFLEGDVQHWWHPPSGHGVRTRISDDFLWLPFAVCHYALTTGDRGVLDERAGFLRAPLLAQGQEEAYGLPDRADEDGTLYEHCVRALKHGMTQGPHGLPLMGTGDWNDGMNKVGAGGKGESVWVGWFLLSCLRRFAPLAEARGDSAWAETCRREADRLHQALEQHAWDGEWYLRAWFDDGTPLGSKGDEECQIDSLPQSWAVISGAGDPERAKRALASVEARLVRENDRLILLFTPPFDGKGKQHPGYIQGYVPGIRENGGQYTHAATWVVQATALVGRGTRAAELFALLNPVVHSDSAEKVALYRVEPYVVVADVYGAPPHVGRGGWTWYTGSAGWLYRVGLETLLGFQRHGDRLVIDPRIPKEWPGFSLTYRYRSATYRIEVVNQGVEQGVARVRLDGRPLEDRVVPLADDGKEHQVRVEMG